MFGIWCYSKVYDFATVLQVKVDLLLRETEEDLPIQPSCYLFVIKQIKKHHNDLRYCGFMVSMKNLTLLEQQYVCLKRKRNLRQRKHRFENEDFEY